MVVLASARGGLGSGPVCGLGSAVAVPERGGSAKTAGVARYSQRVGSPGASGRGDCGRAGQRGGRGARRSAVGGGRGSRAVRTGGCGPGHTPPKKGGLGRGTSQGRRFQGQA